MRKDEIKIGEEYAVNPKIEGFGSRSRELNHLRHFVVHEKVDQDLKDHTRFSAKSRVVSGVRGLLEGEPAWLPNRQVIYRWAVYQHAVSLTERAAVDARKAEEDAQAVRRRLQHVLSRLEDHAPDRLEGLRDQVITQTTRSHQHVHIAAKMRASDLSDLLIVIETLLDERDTGAGSG